MIRYFTLTSFDSVAIIFMFFFYYSSHKTREFDPTAYHRSTTAWDLFQVLCGHIAFFGYALCRAMLRPLYVSVYSLEIVKMKMKIVNIDINNDLEITFT